MKNVDATVETLGGAAAAATGASARSSNVGDLRGAADGAADAADAHVIKPLAQRDAHRPPTGSGRGRLPPDDVEGD